MTLLVLNAGSSSLKFALFERGDEELRRRLHGQFDGLGSRPTFEVSDTTRRLGEETLAAETDHEAAIARLLDWLDDAALLDGVTAAGHRVVHGGAQHEIPVTVDPQILAQLHDLIPLAPLHLPHNLAAIEALARQRPELPQVVCFDTAFHHNMPALEQHYALPVEWYERGVRRYGFHGLSYEYIASQLPHHLGATGEGYVIVAHLGHGASLCAMHERRSAATTMGFTPLDGIPMATRPGHLDPGVITWWLREAGLDTAQIEDLLNHRSGLLGLSGISGDMRELLASHAPGATLAIDYFVHHTARAIASLAGALGGLDALVFTAGIGENAPLIRARVCDRLAWLGIELDDEANHAQAIRLSRRNSRISVWRIPTDEEQMIARHTARLVETRKP